jgi:hypothetical protein
LVEGSTPEEAWPLKSPEHSDLEWLKMCEAKKTVWKFADPLGYDSVFHAVTDELRAMVIPTSFGIEGIPSAFIPFFSFMSHMQPKFRMLLELKDSRALLLLACWYAKICHSQWWVARRALLECQTTCLYLERHHAGETAIQELL